jgi:hypothetical protein
MNVATELDIDVAQSRSLGQVAAGQGRDARFALDEVMKAYDTAHFVHAIHVEKRQMWGLR